MFDGAWSTVKGEILETKSQILKHLYIFYHLLQINKYKTGVESLF